MYGENDIERQLQTEFDRYISNLLEYLFKIFRRVLDFSIKAKSFYPLFAIVNAKKCQSLLNTIMQIIQIIIQIILKDVGLNRAVNKVLYTSEDDNNISSFRLYQRRHIAKHQHFSIHHYQQLYIAIH